MTSVVRCVRNADTERGSGSRKMWSTGRNENWPLDVAFFAASAFLPRVPRFTSAPGRTTGTMPRATEEKEGGFEGYDETRGVSRFNVEPAFFKEIELPLTKREPSQEALNAPRKRCLPSTSVHSSLFFPRSWFDVYGSVRSAFSRRSRAINGTDDHPAQLGYAQKFL